MWNSIWLRSIAVLGVLCGTAGVARADLIVTIGSTVISEGGTGAIDVTIESDSALDRLTDYLVGFSLSTVGGRELWFVDPQPESHLNDPDYVFAAGSLSITGPPSGNVSLSRLEFTTSDVSDELEGVNGPYSRLLATLDVTASTSFQPQAGDIFTVNLLEADTIFGFFDPEGFTYTPLNYTWTPGTVAVSATQAVPEPSSLVLTGGAIAAFLVRRRRRSVHKHAIRGPS